MLLGVFCFCFSAVARPTDCCCNCVFCTVFSFFLVVVWNVFKNYLLFLRNLVLFVLLSRSTFLGWAPFYSCSRRATLCCRLRLFYSARALYFSGSKIVFSSSHFCDLGTLLFLLLSHPFTFCFCSTPPLSWYSISTSTVVTKLKFCVRVVGWEVTDR